MAGEGCLRKEHRVSFGANEMSCTRNFPKKRCCLFSFDLLCSHECSLPLSSGKRLNLALEIQTLARQALSARADCIKAPQMQAYVKSPLPFYGVQAPLQRQVTRGIKQHYPNISRVELFTVVRRLWFEAQRHEEKYIALGLLGAYKKHQIPEAATFYEELLESCWNWDLLDGIATKLFGQILRQNPRLEAYLVKWSESGNFWMRRAAIIGQLKLKDHTNADLLFGLCEKMADEKEFFIRKAIGWALREYAKTNPLAVKAFVEKMAGRLSVLSRREALKHLSD